MLLLIRKHKYKHQTNSLCLFVLLQYIIINNIDKAEAPMKKIIILIIVTMFFYINVFSTVNVESEIGLAVYHDGTCERVGVLKFIVQNNSDFQSATNENPVFIKVKLTDGAVLCRDLDGDNSNNDGVNWVAIDTDNTVNGFKYGDVLIRGAKNQNYIEIMIRNAPGDSANLPSSINQAWFKFGSTLDSSGNNLIVNIYDENSPETYIRSLNYGTPICVDYSGRVNGEDEFLPNDINTVVLESYQGSIDGQPLGIGFSPPNPPIAYGNEDSPNIHYISASSNEYGVISPQGEIPVANGLNQEFIFIPFSNYHLKNIIVDKSSVGILNAYTFHGVTENHSIYAEFVRNNPPIINSFASNKTSGNCPTTVTFNVDATNPKGGKIIFFKWDFDGDGKVDLTTTENTASYQYKSEGIFQATVTVTDDEFETTTSNPIKIEISKLFTYYIPKELANGILNCINPFNDGGNVLIKAINIQNEVSFEYNYPLFCNGKTIVNLLPLFTEDIEFLAISSDRRIIFTLEGKFDNSNFATYLINQTEKQLKLPHVAEETLQWDTFALITNSNKSEVNISTGETTINIERKNAFAVNLSYCFQENINQNSWFGYIETHTTNPFETGFSLSGFEIFKYKQSDGAAIELINTLTKKFFIPHITNKDEFWTGFAFTNFSNREVELTAYFYSLLGEPIFQKTIMLSAKSKLKGTFKQLFEQNSNSIAWGIVETSEPIQAIEIYGTYLSGICGFNLNNTLITKGVFPLLNLTNSNWTGLAICNPNNDTVQIKLSVVSKTGNTKETALKTIAPFGKFSGTIKQLFSEIPNETDYILLESTLPVTAVSAIGDTEYTFLKAVNITEK